MSVPKNIFNVKYFGKEHLRSSQSNKSIDVIGIDTEADKTGKCFMICTSLGDVFTFKDFPRFLFTRKYRGKNFVVYNLKYDAGAFLQFLPRYKLTQLWKKDVCLYKGYKFRAIGTKMLSVNSGKNTCHFYDCSAFYTGSLDYNAKKYLGKQKIEIETKTFTKAYIKKNWDTIAEYCIYDATLTKELMDIMIKKFESFDVYPRKLYSTAYVSFQYFRTHCNYPTVAKIWKYDKKVLDYALQAYNGGKFEVVKKGCGYFYEYDIISAYPHEIMNLIDISKAQFVRDQKYREDATYGFYLCDLYIPMNVYSPVAVKVRNICYYVVDEFTKVITKEEYEYLVRHGCDITIRDAIHIFADARKKPFRKEIRKLMKYKHEFKREGKKLDYHTIKIFLNSLYGKMCQLVDKGNYWQASSCWNPIYGSIITANVRIRISELQMQYKDIYAVHTDSIITTSPIAAKKSGKIGDLIYETEGEGVVLGCGIYQVGAKSKFRGNIIEEPLLHKIKGHNKKLKIVKKRPISWREVAFRSLDIKRLNRFEDDVKYIRPDMDSKRIWVKDWKTFKDVFRRTVESLPYPAVLLRL